MNSPINQFIPRDGCPDTSRWLQILRPRQVVTREDDGTASGNTKEYCRTILMSDGPADAQAGITLAAVRDLSENACTRPAPRQLRCIAWTPFRLTPVSALRVKLEARIHVQMLLAEMSRDYQHRPTPP